MADIIQIRRDTAANWATVDPVLAQGEFAWALDTNELKLGDGATIYSLLPTFSGSIEAQDNGASIVQAMVFNFTGGGVAVTDVGGVATINIPSAPAAPVDSVFGRTGAVVAVSGDYTGAQVTYSNTTSGLTATDVQAAIDEVEGRVDTLEAAPGAPVDSVFGRTGAVVAVAGDYNAVQVNYDNASSGLTATDVNAAIDEVEARVDVLEAAPGAPVDSVFGRTGAVVAVAGDYGANQVTFDDTNVSVTAPDVQSAIQQLYDRVGVFEAFNTDTTTNLNTGGLTQVPIFGTTTQAGPTGYFTVAGNAVTINLAMRVKVSANVSYTSTTNRTNAAIGFSQNGAIQGATGRSGYIRNSNGHNEASVHSSTIIDCAIGDQLGLFSQQQAAAGTVTMIAARCNYIVEILELL